MNYLWKCTFCVWITIAFCAELHSTISVAVIIEASCFEKTKGILLIQKESDPFIYALPEGRVDETSDFEQSMKRQIKEMLCLDIKDFYIAQYYWNGEEQQGVCIAHTDSQPSSGSGIAHAWIAPLDEIPWDHLLSNHVEILQQYFRGRCE